MPIDQPIEENFETMPAPEEKNRKVVLAVGGIALITLAVFILFLFWVSKKSIQKISAPVFPSPTPTIIEQTPRSSSPYATDSAILKIEEDLKNLDQELQTTDLKESGLNPPVLDMKVEFNEP